MSDFKLRNERGLDADGLLGADVLLAFDLDIDVPGGQLTLYRPGVAREHACHGGSRRWKFPVSGFARTAC